MLGHPLQLDKPKIIGAAMALVFVACTTHASASYSHGGRGGSIKQDTRLAVGVASKMPSCGHSHPKRHVPTLNAVAGRTLSGKLLEVISCTAPGALSNVKIAWGDGRVSSGKAVTSRATETWFIVFTGRHVYRQPTCPHPPTPGANYAAEPTQLPCPGYRLSIRYQERERGGHVRFRRQSVLVYVAAHQ